MKGELIRLHLIDKDHEVYQMHGYRPGIMVPDVFITTQWRISDEVIQSFIGIEIHLHEKQKLPSYQAGICTGYFPLKGAYGLVFVNDPVLAGRVQLTGWGQEQARIYNEA